MNEVTRVLTAIESGDPDAGELLLPLVYDELRKLAARRLAREKPGQTLQATALVHEAYLRLVGSETPVKWAGRGHFFGAAAEAMRRIIVENARHKRTKKRAGNRRPLSLDALEATSDLPGEEILDLDEALKKLEVEEPGKAALVKLRYFAGLSEEEAAAALGISRATAARHWRYAKVWLFSELQGPDAAEAN